VTPEQKAREAIDAMLVATGWTVQDMGTFDLSASRGVAIREFPLDAGFADYMLFVDGQAVGVVEAKKEGTTLSGVDTQSQKYLDGLPDYVQRVQAPLPFAYESTGIETVFRDVRDPDYRSRRVYSFHQPQTLMEWAEQKDTLRARLKCFPPLDTRDLRACQVEAITGLEHSFADNRPRSLIQMATGSGKTFTAVSAAYRLIKYAGAKRILFLVDRGNLGRQTLNEFQQFTTPDDGRKFSELYNIQRLQGQAIDPVSKVAISTIQRLYSILRGEELDEELDERSLAELTGINERPKEVAYNRDLPPETFDFIIVDESHRSIYNVWRQVLEYFDAFLVGLTATPSKQTLGFFNQNLVMEYNHERAVADGVNVGYDVYRIKTSITEKGSKVEAGQAVDLRDKASRKVRWEQLDDDLEYQQNQLDRSVVARDQIRTVIKTYRDRLFTDLFPGRTEVPKTLIFAKNDSHAEDIVEIVKEEFGKGNEFCKKITYRTQEKADDLIAAFRNSYNPRIAVTVDMISTGTDVKPLEALIFMRDVKSQVYFEQMIGRGTRVIPDTDLIAVTPDAKSKTHFVLVDAIGVTESNKSTDVRPLEQKRGVSFGKLMDMVAFGQRDKSTLQSLGNRLARLDRELDSKDRKTITETTGGIDLSALANSLFDAVDPDKQREHAKQQCGTENPKEDQILQAATALAAEASKPFNNANVRNVLAELKTRSEQVIDSISKDQVTYAGYDRDKAVQMVSNFQKFIDDNKDELLALQILYNQPYGQQQVTFTAIKQLAEALQKPPYYLDVDRLWTAYEQLEKDKVAGAPTTKVLTNIISLVRYAIGQAEVLKPYPEQVDERFNAWLAQQQQKRQFTAEQLEWLAMIKDQITTSLEVEAENFNDVPFSQKGGQLKAIKLFGQELPKILDELNRELAA
jgi:type I restriction enzyme R subunit